MGAMWVGVTLDYNGARKKSPVKRGLILTFDFSPALIVVPVVNLFRGLILSVAITLLNFAFELIALASNNIKIVVSELTPLLFDLAFNLFPISFDAVPVHVDAPLVQRIADYR